MNWNDRDGIAKITKIDGRFCYMLNRENAIGKEFFTSRVGIHCRGEICYNLTSAHKRIGSPMLINNLREQPLECFVILVDFLLIVGILPPSCSPSIIIIKCQVE
jgi:hypothetical protein